LEGFFDLEKAKAVVYLLSDGDNKNKILISDEELLVIHKNQKHLFPLNNVKKLETQNKKLLFPLIAGGIITPFAFLSYFVNLFLPWIHLISIMLGSLLFYIGWNGTSTLTIISKNGEELNFYLPSISRNLLAFIDYANMFLRDDQNTAYRDLLFFEIEKKRLKYLTDPETINTTPEIFPLLGYTYHQLKLLSKPLNVPNLVAIDPTNSGQEIKFVFDLKTNQMRPRLDGPVLKNSIVDVGN